MVRLVSKDSLKKAVNFLDIGASVRDLSRRGRYMLNRKAVSRNARFIMTGAPDGLPIPPAELIYRVTGQFDAHAFFENGNKGADCIGKVLGRHGLNIQDFRYILDFGCGCGRIMRHWEKLSDARLYGVDYNPRLVAWCKANLPFAEFAVNRPFVSLEFGDNQFDFIYAISVFTHLTEEHQQFWMAELRRVLKPGGYLLFSVHGISRLSELKPGQREAFEAGAPVIVGSQYSGTNFCGTYHPEEYVRRVLCRNFDSLAFEKGAAKDARQDVFLARKPL